MGAEGKRETVGERLLDVECAENVFHVIVRIRELRVTAVVDVFRFEDDAVVARREQENRRRSGDHVVIMFGSHALCSRAGERTGDADVHHGAFEEEIGDVLNERNLCPGAKSYGGMSLLES